jgi:lipopolysaccharide transport system ATP-binding protein
MSADDIVISVKDLGKKYSIGGPQEKYLTFRDAITNSIRSPFRHLMTRQPPREFWALKDVSFDVEQGEVVGIIGRNGAGKSTLLKILSRITSPTVGAVDLYGRVGSLLEVGTGFHPEMTGRENIFLNGSILGMKKTEIDCKLDEIVKFSEIEKFLDTPVKKYSSGMYVRLAFAVAAHMDTEILLVDEVLAVGDAAFQKKCMGKMGDVAAKEGRTVLFVSHNMGAIKRLCQRSIWINNGQIFMNDETNATVTAYLNENVAENIEEAITFQNNSELPFFIRKVALIDKNNISSRHYYINSPIFIDIEYVVRETLSQSFVIFNISREGIKIFQSHDTDLNPQLIGIRQSGIYHARVQLPKKLLASGRYQLSVKAAIGPNGEFGYDSHDDILNFYIDDIDDETLFKGYRKDRNTLIITELNWQTEKINT